jgi:phosphatidylinositol alpha-mannosyltransferase
MKIALVSPYGHQVAGGVREHVMNLDRQFQALGHDVSVIAPASHADGLAPNVVRVSRRVVPLPGSGSIARISLSPLVDRRVKRILQTGRFDVVHVHEPLMPAVCFAALRHSKGPTIGTIHGYRGTYFVYRYLNPMLRRMMDRLAGRIAVSLDALHWAAQYFPGDYRIIPDGVDVERFGAPNLTPVQEFDDGGWAPTGYGHRPGWSACRLRWWPRPCKHRAWCTELCARRLLFK